MEGKEDFQKDIMKIKRMNMNHVMDIDICFEVKRNVEGTYTDCGICHENYNDSQLKSVSFIL